MYKCARVLEMAIAPITHYAINITLTKVNRARTRFTCARRGGLDAHVICHVQEGVVSIAHAVCHVHRRMLA